MNRYAYIIKPPSRPPCKNISLKKCEKVKKMLAIRREAQEDYRFVRSMREEVCQREYLNLLQEAVKELKYIQKALWLYREQI